jgi:hypothetical protein
MEYLNAWFHDLELRKNKGLEWKQNINVVGECRRSIGPSNWFAAVVLDFSPNSHFDVEYRLDNEISKLAHDRGWYEHIVFGVLDILLITPPKPICKFKLCINQIEYNEMESSQIAFRLAARNATIKALEIHFPAYKTHRLAGE